jgi:hypothetical protein
MQKKATRKKAEKRQEVKKRPLKKALCIIAYLGKFFQFFAPVRCHEKVTIKVT